MRIMGLDYGTKTVGVAISDALKITAQGIETIQRKEENRRTGLEVVMWDERLTTVAAERTLIESSVRRENRKQYVDKIAAVFILQGYLDLLSMRNGADGED